jgi:hypothetical protein
MKPLTAINEQDVVTRIKDRVWQRFEVNEQVYMNNLREMHPKYEADRAVADVLSWVLKVIDEELRTLSR